jgi:hypothetical protein
MMSKEKVLCVGHDFALLGVRSSVLASAGVYTTVATPYWATLLLRKEHFDAVVLCHTLAKSERRLLGFQIESLERTTAVVQIYSSSQIPEFLFACPSDDSEQLLSVLVSALRGGWSAATA